jgi:16S rRNA G1207 methylase RsmC
METQDYLTSLRKDIIFRESLGRHEFIFHSTWGLFSPRQIDEGTQLLIRYLDIPANAQCLDIGCGYGPIGLYLARQSPQGQTLLVDKDFVAVEYSNKNIAANKIPNARVILSNGFVQIPEEKRFDIIASNIPAKVGKELLTLFLHDAKQRLNPGGKLYVVTINGLRQFMKRNLNEVFEDYKKLKQGPGYTVAVARA